jgi:spoIIIJ-associated protein
MVELRTEAEGANVAEARARAIAEIRRQAPWLEEEAIAVQVVEEGERGLLGIGARPARVVAFAEAPDQPSRDESELAAAIRAYAERVASTIAEGAHAEVSEDTDGIIVSFAGSDLGRLIGKRGQTIEAIAQLANAIAYHQAGPDVKRITVDAGGYRERQKATLSYAALGAAKRAIASGEPQPLEPMSAFERRVVHERLKGYPGVTTASEGTEPSRYIVVMPEDAD